MYAFFSVVLSAGASVFCRPCRKNRPGAPVALHHYRISRRRQPHLLFFRISARHAAGSQDSQKKLPGELTQTPALSRRSGRNYTLFGKIVKDARLSPKFYQKEQKEWINMARKEI